MSAPARAAHHRFEVLDGWRGISILAVLACHLLPLGAKDWQLNDAAGLFGMALFFCLSGFLISTFLLRRESVSDFLIRRLCRILPLAWLGLLVGLGMAHARPAVYVANFLFFANYPPFWLTPVTSHFWSLCVEVQFYALIALVFGFFGKRGLRYFLPAACLAVTLLRVQAGMHESIVTYYRIDEILAGGVLALIVAGEFGVRPRTWVGSPSPYLMLPLFAVATLPQAGPLNYLRPYLAAALVGATLCGGPSTLTPLLKSRALAYIAAISYSLYIVHPMLEDTWLGAGTTWVRYAKRPLLFLAIFAVAHASTFWYEHRWIAFGRRLSARLGTGVRAVPAAD